MLDLQRDPRYECMPRHNIFDGESNVAVEENRRQDITRWVSRRDDTNAGINTKRLRSRTVELNMTDQENATPMAHSGPYKSLPTPLTTRYDTNTTSDTRIDELRRALSTLIGNREKTHQTRSYDENIRRSPGEWQH